MIGERRPRGHERGQFGIGDAPFALHDGQQPGVGLGTADGLRAVTPEGEVPPADLGDLRQLLANATELKAITAPAELEEPTKRRGK